MKAKLESVLLLCLSFLASACLQDLFFPDSSSDDSGIPPASAPSAAVSKTNSSTSANTNKVPSPAFSGSEPKAVVVPGPGGPFVEPPLDGRPEFIYLVVVGSAEHPWDLETGLKKVESLEQVPIGYPAVDQKREGKGFVLVSGRFARAQWADALARSLRSAGEDASVVKKPYEFDRLKPAANSRPGPRAGRIFAGVAGVSVPMLESAGKQAQGTGVELTDGALVEVVGGKWADNRLWLEIRYRNKMGFVPAGRVLVDANLFAAPGGASAVLGVTLGCKEGHCWWDYWLVKKAFEKRLLLKSAGERMPHAFSPDGNWLAYTTFDPSILVRSTTGPRTLELGPGISPSFSPDGKLLYFRGPGVKGQRDDVRSSLVDDWKSGTKPPIKQVFDFKGTPMYPRAISTVPPRVDFLEKGKLFTLFYRLGQKVAKKSVHRWGVVFTPDGKILEKAGVAISD